MKHKAKNRLSKMIHALNEQNIHKEIKAAGAVEKEVSI
jgi:hypothetical protein